MKKTLLNILGLLFLIFVFGQEAFGQNNEVIVTSFPDGAAIVVDGVDTGKITPAELQGINPGKHVITVSVAGWQSTTTTANILDKDKDGKDRDTHLTFVLMPILTTGPQGPAGAQGPAGSVGPQGPAGASGVGTVGAIGLQGPVGPAGPAGKDGAVGPNGAAGATGNTGAPGSNGVDGAAGPQGPMGPMGISISGPQGLQGPKGDTGAAGAVGSQGSAGAASTVPGPQGPTGPAGPTGANAFAGYWTLGNVYDAGQIVLWAVNGNLGVYLNVTGSDPTPPDQDTANWSKLASSGGTAAVPTPLPPPGPTQGATITGSYSIMANFSLSDPCGATANGTITVDGNGGYNGSLTCGGGTCQVSGSIVANPNSTSNFILLGSGSGCHWGGSVFEQLTLSALTLNQTGFVWNVASVSNPGSTIPCCSMSTIGISATLQ